MENKTFKNRSTRRISRLLISMAMLLIAGMVLLTSCGGSGLTDIVIKESDMPRTSYVQGEELDLTGGVLTTIVDGSEVVIPMTDPAVSITGYNKDSLGKQTLTVTYQEKTTTFEVNVVAKMVADGYKSEYFINDEFDKTAGKLKINNPTGKAITVNFDSELVTLKTFNNTKAGDSVVTVVYDDKQGNVHEASFTVKFYEIGEISFTKPSKTLYSSHDTELAIAGGYFTVKAKDSSLSRFVPLTADMASGFDVSAATEENRTTPLVQTVTFTYAGKSFDFDISILYSGVSVVKDAAKALANVEVTGKDTVISPELSAIAVDAATEYFKLTQARKSLISEDELLKVMKPAAICVMNAFKDTAERFSNIFKVDFEKAGNLLISAKSYDELKNSIVYFEDEDDPFNVLANTLNGMKEEFADLVLFTETDGIEGTAEVKLSDFVKSPSEEELEFYVDLFKYMLNVSDLLKDVPDTWTVETLENHKSKIEEALNYITSSKYVGPNFSSVYISISSWRTNNDYFEIIYAYYLEDPANYEFFMNKINSAQGLRLPLPRDLQEWYQYISYGANELNVFVENAKNNVFLRDTTIFMYYYNKALEKSEVILNHENPLYQKIYNFIGGKGMMFKFLENPSALGYYYIAFPSFESKAIEHLRDVYSDISALYLEGKLNFELHEDKFTDLIDAMGALTPGEMYAFLCSLNLFYSSYEGTLSSDGSTVEFDYVLNFSTKNFSILSYLLAAYTVNTFEGDARNIMVDLFTAMEKCALIEVRENGLADFRAQIATLKTNYALLSTADQALFDRIAGDIYTKYIALDEFYGNTVLPDIGDHTDDFNTLIEDIKQFYVFLNMVNGDELTDEEKQYIYGMIFPLSEKILTVYNRLLSTKNADLIKALSGFAFTANDFTLTIDKAIFSVKNVFYYNLVFRPIEIGSSSGTYSTSLWTMYKDFDGLRAFMGQIADILVKYYNEQPVSAAEIQSLINGIRTLSTDETTVFYMFGINVYYDTLLDFFTTNDEAKENTRAILQLELGYIEYSKNPSEAGRVEYFKNIVASAKTAYEKLEGSMDSMLVEFYEYYMAKYNEAFPSES